MFTLDAWSIVVEELQRELDNVATEEYDVDRVAKVLRLQELIVELQNIWQDWEDSR